MPDFLRTSVDSVRDITPRDALDILVIAGMVYALLRVLRGTTAIGLLRGGLIIFAAAALLAWWANLTALKWLLGYLLTGLLVGILIIFQPEIRRTLERAGRTRVPSLRTRAVQNAQIDALIEAIAGGCRELSARRHGALIVLERETGLEDYIDTGRRLDAVPSGDLLANVFFRNSPLHDGAVIVRGDRLAAAACTLPLSEATMDGHVGTRHRAGIGISERTDAVAVIVSEESGDISVASNGRLVSKLDEPRLRTLLANLLGRGGRAARRRLRRAARARLAGRTAQREVVG